MQSSNCREQTVHIQEAHLSQRDRAMLRVIEYFAVTFLRSLKMVPFKNFSTVSYLHSIGTVAILEILQIMT